MDRKALALTLACFSLTIATSCAKEIELRKKAKDAYIRDDCTSAIKLLNDYKAGGLSTSEVMNVDSAIKCCDQCISMQKLQSHLTDNPCFTEVKIIKLSPLHDCNDITKRVNSIISDKLGVYLSEVVPDASFVNDLGADSLDVVELIMSMEEEFDIQISDEDAEKITTVALAINFIEKKCTAPPSR